MLHDQATRNNANWQITDGLTVYAVDGPKLGTVRNFDSQVGYLDVHKGWLFGKDFYVPLAAVTDADGDGVMLGLTRDEVEHGPYATPPATTEVVYGETSAAGIVGPDTEKVPLMTDHEDTTTMHTADGRPIV